MTDTKFYVVKCNNAECRYLGFINKLNKSSRSSNIIYTGQTGKSDIKTALYFDNEYDAYLAADNYIAAGRIMKQYERFVKPQEVYLSDIEVNDLKKVFTDIECDAYILNTAYQRFCNN